MNGEDWLAQVTEPPLAPGLAICDAHHHLWDPPGNPARRYLLDDLSADIRESGHRVVSTVFMECMAEYRSGGPEHLRPVGETAYVHDIAEQAAASGTGICAAIVGYADLRQGARAGEVLDAHLDASHRFRGIRHATAWDADPAVRDAHTDPVRGQLSDSAFRKGMAELGRRGLTFDAWLYHPQIPELTELARAFPDQVIVLDHLGGPLGIGPYAGKRAAIFEQWRIDISALARCPNVHAKLGGLAMPVNGFGFHKRPCPPDSETLANAIGPYFEHMLETFGTQRCMLESNFPVDRASCSYGVLWNAFKRCIAQLSEAEQRALAHDNAARLYAVDRPCQAPLPT